MMRCVHRFSFHAVNVDRALYHMQGAQCRHLHDSQLEVNGSFGYALITSQTETQPYSYSIKAVHLNLKVIFQIRRSIIKPHKVSSTYVPKSKLLLTTSLDYEKAASTQPFIHK